MWPRTAEVARQQREAIASVTIALIVIGLSALVRSWVPLAAGLTVLMVSAASTGRRAMASHGARRLLRWTPAAAFTTAWGALVLPTAAGAPFELALPLDLLSVVAVGVGAASMFLPSRLVALLGGPSLEWQLLRERARLAFVADELSASPDREREAKFQRDVTALDRFRCPATNNYITLFQAWHAAPDDVTTDADRAAADQIRDLEREIHRSLGAVPSWHATFPWRDRRCRHRRPDLQL